MEKRPIQGISRKLFAKAKPLFASFDGFLVQMCHFHQRKTITSYLTRNPRLDASKDLQKIMYGLTKTTLKHFTEKLAEWHTKYQSFLEEKSVSTITGKEQFTHSRIRSAYKSLLTNLPYLFTYKSEKDIVIHNTTNSLDGGVFSPIFKTNKNT